MLPSIKPIPAPILPNLANTPDRSPLNPYVATVTAEPYPIIPSTNDVAIPLVAPMHGPHFHPSSITIRTLSTPLIDTPNIEASPSNVIATVNNTHDAIISSDDIAFFLP